VLKIALGLVHNKNTALANHQQIQNLLPMVVTNTEPVTLRKYYTLSGVTMEHEAIFFQVVPFGVTPPNNLSDLDSYKVFYGNNDTDKTGDHARFFNWLFKRGTDYGADVVLYVRFPSLFGAVDLDLRLARITSTRVFIEAAWGKAVHVKLLRVLRAAVEETLDESLQFDNAVTALKARIIARGLEWE
jgi:hypothetical protein